MGLPTKYTPEIAAEICRRLADGESLRAICRDEDMPRRRTVREWVNKDVDGFAARYTQARELGLDELADYLLEIADDGANDWMASHNPDNPGYDFNGEHFRRSQLRVDTRKWYLEKLAPRRFGNRQSLELTGADGGPVQFTDTERAARLAAIVAKARQRVQNAQEGDDDNLGGLV